MGADRLLEELRRLETELHQIETRRSRQRLEALLHPEFVEFGRSGQRYDRAAVLAEFSMNGSAEPALVFSRDFQAVKIGYDAALLTYRSAHVAPDGSLHRFSIRSSLWLRTAAGWRMRSHQGTPADEFRK